MRAIFISHAAGILAAASAFSSTAFAQATTEEYELEEITVTAEKVERDLQKTAISIQVVSGEQLAAEGKKRIDEIISGTVGLQVQDGPTGATVYMRGINGTLFASAAGAANASTVAIVIDGVYQARSETVRGSTLDVSQVEVMRGTQSTTLGASSLIGAVSVVTNQPVFNFEGSGSLEFGNYNLLATQAVLNAPLSDNQALRIAYATNKRDGYISSNAGESDLSNARMKYRWQATDNLNVVATYEQQRIGGNGQAQSVLSYDGYWEAAAASRVPTASGGTCTSNCYDWIAGYPTAYGHVATTTTYMDRSDPWDDGFPKKGYTNGPYYDSKLDTLSGNIDWNLGFGNLTLLPSYQRAEFVSNEPNIRTSIAHQNQTQNTYQFEARLASAAGSRLEWLVGAYWYDTTIDSLFGTEIPPNITPATTGCPTVPANTANCWRYQDTKDAYQRTYSFYANVKWPIIDDLRLLAGVRYSHDDKGFKSSLQKWGTTTGPSSPFVAADYLSIAQGGTNPNTQPAPSGVNGAGLTQGGTGEKSFSGTPFRVGLEYDVVPSAMLYATYSKGYQAGNVQLSNYLTGGTPEFELEQYTVGAKSRWFDNRLQANVELFRSEFKNQPSAATPTATVGLTGGVYNGTTLSDLQCPGGAGNAGTWNPTAGFACARQLAAVVPMIKSQGVDVELNWLPTANDRIDATVEYLESVQEAPTISVTAAQLATTPGIVDPAAANALIAGLNSYASAFDGRTLQNSPKWSANASYSHAFELAGGSTLTPRINAIYKSEYYTSGFGSVNISDPVLLARSTQKAYTLWNAFLSWQAAEGKFHIDAYVKNIDNKPVLLNYNLGGPVPATSRGAVSLDAPRTFGVLFGVKL